MTVNKKMENNFKTVWVRYGTTSSDRHQLFMKEYSVKNQAPEYPKGKTLFVLNVPPYATTESVTQVFGDVCGAVKLVKFLENPDQSLGFKTAYIVFAKEKAVKNALSLKSEFTLTLNTSSVPVLTGIEKWCKQYNESIENESKIKEIINQCLINFDKKKEQEKDQEKMLEEVDSDGWTTVTSKKKRGKLAVARKESTFKKIHAKEEIKKPKRELLNFYTFQIREAKKERLAELRKKFELDKKKLEQIKAKRNFKPF